MTTKAKVKAGACGFISTVEVKNVDGSIIKINIDSDCKMVSNMNDDLKELDWNQLFEGFFNSPVYKAANDNSLHPDCPVPLGVLKACNVEMGFMLPSEVKIEFE